MVWIVLAGLLAFAAFVFVPERRTPVQKAEVPTLGTPEGGAPLYAARLGDCAACHTAEGGEPFAGGRPIKSPFGAIYSSNITPDPDTGIGGITLDQFRAALYDGIGQHGENLYPAMPYANYRKLTEADVQALHEYFTAELKPVRNAVPQTDLDFPFNLRWGIRAWKWVALPSAGFEPRFGDPQLNRGAYLVEGPGHCGACHSPRNLVFAQEGYTSEDAAFLSGGSVGGWSAPDLRSAVAGWSSFDIDLFLATGRNAYAGVNGEMKLAIEHSLQFLTAEDRSAMTAYLVALGPTRDKPADGVPAVVVSRAETFGAETATATERLLIAAEPGMPLGARLYLDNCAACHFVDGKGGSQIFPALDGNATVTADSPAGLVATILEGAELPSTRMRPMAVAMPGFGGRLNDSEVAELASFVRGAWHNKAGPITAATVGELRGKVSNAN
jgi:mono/diheme cytochrome c family protein